MQPDRHASPDQARDDPPAPLMAVLLLVILFIWLPIAVAATIWWNA